eukprot:6481583-Amphidinium_carterae.1
MNLHTISRSLWKPEHPPEKGKHRVKLLRNESLRDRYVHHLLCIRDGAESRRAFHWTVHQAAAGRNPSTAFSDTWDMPRSRHQGGPLRARYFERCM